MSLRPDDIKRVFSRYHERLTAYREALNGLNVYPVPDGDTGTNMSLTLRAVVEQIDGASSMAEVSRAISYGSLMGARGNSGVILSQILRGIAETFRDHSEVDVAHLVLALDRASEAAYAAVQRPVEGTILTVLREASEAAGSIGSDVGLDLAGLLRAVYERAVDALERTPEMLPVLKQAGVVDAGGAGFLLLLSAFLEVVTGTDVELPEHVLRARARLEGLGVAQPEVAELRYEVMFFLDARADAVAELREAWDRLGDSIVVVGGDGTWNCHIHTDDIGATIEVAIRAGRPHDIRVTDLHEQAADEAVHAADGDLGFAPKAEYAVAPVGVVAVTVGAGLIDVFRELGVQGVASGGQSLNPSTEELLRAVERVPARQVVVLPNNKNIVPVAEQLDGLTTKRVVVVPTRSVQQGIAAMLGYSPAHHNVDQAIDDMAAAASSVVDGEIARAVRTAIVPFGTINEGDWIAIADGTIVAAEPDLEAALRGLVAAILPPFAELLTIYSGVGSQRSATKALVAWLDELHPELTVDEIEGGQPLYPYLVSIE